MRKILPSEEDRGLDRITTIEGPFKKKKTLSSSAKAVIGGLTLVLILLIIFA